MQVIISDVHLTDGSSGQTINAGAFRVFKDNLKVLVESVKAKSQVTELKIVLLGDIFDIIRSTKWLNNTVRPWSSTGPRQEAVVLEIVKDILSLPENRRALDCFKELRAFAASAGFGFDLQYVIGNHDWLINRYPVCRNAVAHALGMGTPAVGDTPPFPTEIFDPVYRTFARHGDIYDEFNYMGGRDRSSIGDAIVIELLGRFPTVVEKELAALLAAGAITAEEKKWLVNRLKELDNIRPLLDTPSWILMVMNESRTSAARQAIEDSWAKCVDNFFRIPFIKKMDIPFWPDTIDKLQVALQLSSHTSKWILEKIADLKARFFPTGVDAGYHKKAYSEAKVRSGEADFVIYGHTHDALIIPMDHLNLGSGKDRDQIYFNTGTWRQTWNKAVMDGVNREFIGWKVLTYVAFYREEENNQYSFEVWNGALG